MPYIKPESRRIVTSDYYSEKEGGPTSELHMSIADTCTKGDLNYCISRLLYSYVGIKKPNYQNISDAISAATDAAEEFRRRVMNPYEDKKIKENGDIES